MRTVRPIGPIVAELVSTDTRVSPGRRQASLLAPVAAFPQDVASIVQVLRPDYQLVWAAWHAISGPRSQVRLSARAFDTRTPQQRAQQFCFRLGANDFDDRRFLHATSLCGEAERLIVVERSQPAYALGDRRMRREEGRHALPCPWVHGVERRCRRVTVTGRACELRSSASAAPGGAG